MKSDELIGLGLTDGEAKAYFALTKLGISTVGPIAKETGISYSKIYEVLQRLITKGLVSFVMKEKTKYFQAAEPYELEHFIEKKEERLSEQKEKLKKIIPSLIKLSSIDDQKTEAEIFSGFKGLRTAYFKLIEGVDPKKDEYIFFYVNQMDYSKEVDQFFERILPHYKQKGFNTRGVADQSYDNSKLIRKNSFVKMKFIKYPIIGNIDICRDRILITNWGENPTAILIHSKDAARNLRNYFDFVWNS